MTENKPIVLNAFNSHRKIIDIWLSVLYGGLAVFFGQLIFSYFAYKAPSIANNPHNYKIVEPLLGFGGLAGLVVAVVGYTHYADLKVKLSKVAFLQLLSDNGWTFIQHPKIDKVASIVLGAGTYYIEGNAFSGKRNGQTFSCVMFQYDAKVEDASKLKRYICLRYKLPKAYPMLIIDNKSNDRKFTRRSDLPENIPEGVKLSLEGYFDKYYQASTTKGTEQEAMEVLSPDFMSVLVDLAKYKVDIEISDKDLFLIYESNFYSEQNIAALFTVAGILDQRMLKISKTWMASSEYEEQIIAQSATAARDKLMARVTHVSIISVVVVLFFLAEYIFMLIHNNGNGYPFWLT